MTREIEYRQFVNGKMVYSGFERCGSFVMPNVNISIYPIMQYTGLKDKQGIKIFEGDVIQSHHFYDTQGVEQFLTHIVEWSDKYSGWFALNADSMDESDGSQQLWAYMENAISPKVIGNIHEGSK